MFRSLLLLSVLATLFVIAFKGPDQTALQYAAEIGVRASELFPRAETIPAIATRPGEPRSPTEPQPAVLEAWDDLDRRMRETFGTDEAEPVRPATISVAPVVAGGRQLHATGPAPSPSAPLRLSRRRRCRLSRSLSWRRGLPSRPRPRCRRISGSSNATTRTRAASSPKSNEVRPAIPVVRALRPTSDRCC